LRFGHSRLFTLQQSKTNPTLNLRSAISDPYYYCPRLFLSPAHGPAISAAPRLQEVLPWAERRLSAAFRIGVGDKYLHWPGPAAPFSPRGSAVRQAGAFRPPAVVAIAVTAAADAAVFVAVAAVAVAALVAAAPDAASPGAAEAASRIWVAARSVAGVAAVFAAAESAVVAFSVAGPGVVVFVVAVAARI
jgi:hypothetical protein